MRLYTSHMLLFIHIPKTAGTSLIKFLDEEIGGYILIDGRNPHSTLAEVYNDVVQPDTKIFTVVRNPFDLAVSMYEFFKVSSDSKKYPHKKLAKKYKFDKWLVDWYKDNYRPTQDYICLDGSLANNLSIIKFENLTKDLDEFFNKELHLDIDFSKLPVLNSTRHKPWSRYYDSESSKLVKEKCKWTFENFYPEML